MVALLVVHQSVDSKVQDSKTKLGSKVVIDLEV